MSQCHATLCEAETLCDTFIALDPLIVLWSLTPLTDQEYSSLALISIESWYHAAIASEDFKDNTLYLILIVRLCYNAQNISYLSSFHGNLTSRKQLSAIVAEAKVILHTTSGGHFPKWWDFHYFS